MPSLPTTFTLHPDCFSPTRNLLDFRSIQTLTVISYRLEKLISQNYYVSPTLSINPTNPLLTRTQLNKGAKDGFRSYINAYSSHSLRSVFDITKMDLVKVAKSFGLSAPPRVDIQLGAGMKRDRDRGRRAYGSQPRQNLKGSYKKRRVDK